MKYLGAKRFEEKDGKYICDKIPGAEDFSKAMAGDVF